MLLLRVYYSYSGTTQSRSSTLSWGTDHIWAHSGNDISKTWQDWLVPAGWWIRYTFPQPFRTSHAT